MHRLISAVLSLLVALPLQARELPRGEYLLVGDVFPAIERGLMLMVYAHVTTGGDRLDWTFFTAFGANEESCKRFGKCRHFVTGFSQEVDWAEDGGVTIRESRRPPPEGNVIDRPEIDGTHVYGAIETLLDRATLDLTAGGGSLTTPSRRGKGREVELIPATLEQAQAAVAVATSFEESLVKLDYCVVRQVLRFIADPDATPAQQDVANAARYNAEILAARRAAYYYYGEAPDARLQAEVDAAKLRLNAFNLARGYPSRAVVEGLLNEAPLTDAEILAEIGPVLDRMLDDAPDLRDEILVTRREELLAAIGLSSRFMLALQYGEDPVTALCRDVTLRR